MKKILVLVAMVALATTAFAQGIEMSAGAGVTFSPFWNTMKGTESGVDFSMGTSSSILGFGAFFDATYIQAELDFLLPSATGKSVVKIDGEVVEEDDFETVKSSYLGITLMGKYPIALGSFSIFPMLGFEYDLNISYENKEDLTDEQKGWLNQFWLKAGIGADFGITEAIYVRPVVLFGYKLPGDMEKTQIEAMEAMGATDVSMSTIKLDIGVYVGYKF